jgi:hypothetical protein
VQKLPGGHSWSLLLLLLLLLLTPLLSAAAAAKLLSEQARIRQAGGQVFYHNGCRVMGALAMTRAIGDHALRPYGEAAAWLYMGCCLLCLLWRLLWHAAVHVSVLAWGAALTLLSGWRLA